MNTPDTQTERSARRFEPIGKAALIASVGGTRGYADWTNPDRRLRRLLSEFIGMAGLTFILSGAAAILARYGGRAAGQDEGEPGHAEELGQQPPQPVVRVGPVGVAPGAADRGDQRGLADGLEAASRSLGLGVRSAHVRISAGRTERRPSRGGSARSG